MKHILYIGNDLRGRNSLPTGIRSLSANLRGEGYEVITASGKQGKLLRLGEMLGTVLQHRKWADVVLIDTYSTWNFWYAYAVAKLCRKLGLRYIPILHGGELPKRFKASPRACSAIFGYAYVNVAPSKYLMALRQAQGALRQAQDDNEKEAQDKKGAVRLSLSKPPPQRMIHIPNSIKISDYAFKERIRLQPKLLWVRAFEEIYNPLQALQVLQELLLKYPEAELCMVGPKKDASYETCLEYAELHNLPVSFPGKLSKADWSSLAADYDLFLNTTSIDNTPVSVIEAMALGLPVVSTDVGGLPYLLEHEKDALLVPPNDPASQADAIERLLENPSLAHELSLTARKKVEAFDWEEVKLLWNQVLR